MDFYNCTQADLGHVISGLNRSTVHAKTLYRSAYREHSLAPWEDPEIPVKLRLDLRQLFANQSGKSQLLSWVSSKYDGTTKFVIKLQDCYEVETVLIPEKNRLTLCLSTQAGCGQGCRFCHTGRMGLLRNLNASEIVGQIIYANRWLKTHQSKSYVLPAVSNIVFMGMGEPMDNVPEVIQAINIMTDPAGLAIAPKRISVSTAGHIDGLEKFMVALPRIAIAISLHASNDQLRSRLMPINLQWPIESLVMAIKKINKMGRYVLIQYTLIAGVNDSIEQADELATLLSGCSVKINLIPFNEFSESRFRGPAPEQLAMFRDRLHSLGYRVLVRFSKGQDIAAACGQLVKSKNSNKSVIQSVSE